MRRLLERINGNDQANPSNKENDNNSIHLNDILDQEATYELDDDDKLYLEDFQKFEKEKAKLWMKPDFQSHLLMFTKLKYNKALTTEKISSYRVYKKLYNDKIKNNKDIGIYEKILFHPDLTQTDYEYIQSENRKVVKNAGIIEFVTISTLGYCYFKTNLKKQRGFYAFFMLAPAFALFGGFSLEKYRFRRKLYSVELDKKYNIPQ